MKQFIGESLTIEDLCALYGRKKSWVYKNSHQLDSAKIRFNGAPIKPFRFDPIKIKELFTSADIRSVKTELVSEKRRHNPPPPEELCL